MRDNYYSTLKDGRRNAFQGWQTMNRRDTQADDKMITAVRYYFQGKEYVL